MRRDMVKYALAVVAESEFGSAKHEVAAWTVWIAMGSAHQEQLKQLLFNGPIWDGNVVSKAARNDLIEWGLAVRCCYRGEQGYTAASYLAYTVYKRGVPEEKPQVMQATDDRSDGTDVKGAGAATMLDMARTRTDGAREGLGGR